MPALTLTNGISSLIILNKIGSLVPLLFILTFTSLPFSPLKSFITFSFFTPILATSLSSTVIIRSPDLIPSF